MLQLMRVMDGIGVSDDIQIQLNNWFWYFTLYCQVQDTV